MVFHNIHASLMGCVGYYIAAQGEGLGLNPLQRIIIPLGVAVVSTVLVWVTRRILDRLWPPKVRNT